ncbi:helix-turn-helix domain-containing protein [Halococcus sp. IIIV-5B]|uniref:helix-turn-helix domain-containing protein n=1 Tax=Halococcus sp. IIIV-5B TaxID=2321230 RepID=UPI000E765B69|nr:helix-turn-helix domain-containing protein [Halococcus sp. IIIV-5B]RJT07186.1 bacterio-opsin activator [Halococcus sp. IIIV-5B]
MTKRDQDRELLRLSVDLWHPGCWGIESTDETGAGIIGHGAAIDGNSGFERHTIYGESTEHLSQAIEVAHESSFIETIHTLEDDSRVVQSPVVGKSTQDVFIEYHADEAIGPAFLSHGFLLDSEYRIEDGLETWMLLVFATREEIRRTLDSIREGRDADITLRKIRPLSGATPTQQIRANEPALTPRQREVLELARNRGYYEWPRHVSARELAGELGISKTTFLEHLRIAESKLLSTADHGYSRRDEST